ncbi:L-glyceraldehyde 3-phosphate reductase [Frondihabitans sp. PhB188]|uniref:aldo/keto reductase n=1 Tax=Frondihabitans sp. PhB188 TaxID=2485200 RepID=UPI000F4716AB|nr:aldo/keto reductase [Frondihabitans sp. PhB188]ROQ41600.1 L-glyceraldehyde 3-phosphate reductase [Frondihabitans sp. PhB188]
MRSPFTPYVADDERYAKLPYDRIGRSGLRLPRISLGLWNNFGSDRPLETQRDILLRAFDRGVTHFDLANNYGPPYGSAEEQFGRVFHANLHSYRDEILISTKAGYDMWPGPYGDGGSRKYLLSSLDQSLGRLGLDYVDIFYSHRPDPTTPIEETMGALATAVRQGKALYVGISNYDPAQTQAAVDALAAEGVPLLIHQPRYNMFDRRPEGGLFDTLLANGIGSIVFSPLAGGLLTGRYLDGIAPAGSRAAEGRWFTSDAFDDDYLTRARGLNAIAEARGQSLAQLSLLWVLRQQAVTSALIGASSVAQLDDSLDALHGADLTDDELAAIEPLAVDGTGSKR